MLSAPQTSLSVEPADRVLRPNGMPRMGLVLRPARLSDGEALQGYFRALSPQARYNRVLAAANELPPSEMARALAANGRDRQTLLLTWAAETGETVVGETRLALWCTERTAEFSMSIAEDWRRLGVGGALLEEIESRAAADGIEWLYGDVLRTNEAMIALARSRGFRVEMGVEARLVRVQKQLDDAALVLPCPRWAEIAARDPQPSWQAQ